MRVHSRNHSSYCLVYWLINQPINELDHIEIKRYYRLLVWVHHGEEELVKMAEPEAEVEPAADANKGTTNYPLVNVSSIDSR